jgi:hypothetical protein
MDNNTPVLLIVFNRPDTTIKVFEAIRKAKPSKIYIAADSPRIGNIDDEKNCALVKEIVTKVDWECKLYFRFAETNQGCGPGPYNSISWAFENEDRLIILEDDCVPCQPFFDYCDELLERYKHDTRIWLISGNQYNEEAVRTSHSYFFSRYGHSWGWATWKRCWAEMDLSMSKYHLFVEQNLYESAFRNRKEAAYFRKINDGIYKDETLKSHIWDVQCGFTIRSNGGLSIVPKKNLVTNIGYLGTHSETKNQFHDRPVDENYRIISHPDFVLCDVTYDSIHFNQHWNKKASVFKRAKWKINQLIKKGRGYL